MLITGRIYATSDVPRCAAKTEAERTRWLTPKLLERLTRTTESSSAEEHERLQEPEPFAWRLYSPIPGLSASAGRNGGLLGHGYDPVRGIPLAPVVNYSYTNFDSEINTWTNPVTGSTHRRPDQLTVSPSSIVSETRSLLTGDLLIHPDLPSPARNPGV